MKRRNFVILNILFTFLFLFTFFFDKSFCSKVYADVTETSGLADTAWPCEGHDSRRTNRSPYLGPQTSTLKWSYLTGGGFYTSPAIGSTARSMLEAGTKMSMPFTQMAA
ncbi:MAG: hypothetical protein ACMUIU_13485 [bacterium]